MNLAKKEKQKYSEIWAAENYTSGTAKKFAQFVKSKVKSKNSIILEIGCGNGTTLKELNVFADAYGLDITTDAAVKNGISKNKLFEMPAWKILDKICLNHYTVSTDVLEHIPLVMIPKTISQIIEVTTVETIHAISTRPAVRLYMGHTVHLTVKPLTWWRKQFEKHNKKGIKITLIDSDEL